MLFRALVFVLSWTPIWLVALSCWLFSWVWWTVLPVRKAVAVANFKLAFPDRNPGPPLRRMTRGLLLGYAEILHLLRQPERAPQVVEMRGLEAVTERAAAGQGTIVAGGHFGSFDLCLMALGKAPGIDVSCIVRQPTQPQAAAFIERARTVFGVGLIEPRDSSEEIERRLEAGGAVLFVVDQRQRSGIRVPFFGHPALTAPSIVAFARRLRLPVVPVLQWRVGVNRHVIQMLPALELEWTEDRDADLKNGIARIHTVFEEQIRSMPHGWLWWHRRWSD